MRLILVALVGLSGAAAEERMDRPVAALREMTQAVNAGDAGRYARLYAPDAVITIHGGGRLEGRAAIEKYEVELLREFPGARLAFYSVWQKGPLAVVHYGVNGKTPAGQPMGHEGLLFYRFDASGGIAEERRYLDSLTPMAQLGALGSAPARPLPKLPERLETHLASGSRSEDENIARLRTAYAALDAGDEAAFLSSVADDVVLEEMTDLAPVVGKARVKAWFQSWSGAVADAKTELVSVLAVGDFVLAETVLRGRLNGTLGRFSVSDRPFTVHRAAIARLKDGKLVRLSTFMNGKELAEAVGQWPPKPAK
jgi:ketosteroid isomerase-like protein